MKKDKGFTLLELICAISIMALFSGVMLPAGSRYISRAREVRERSWACGLWDSMQMYMIEEHDGEYVPGYALLDEIGDSSIPAVQEIISPYIQKRKDQQFEILNIGVSKLTYELMLITYQTDRWLINVTTTGVEMIPR